MSIGALLAAARFALAAPDDQAELFQLAHKPMLEMHLHLMAVGVAELEHPKTVTGLDTLDFAAKDAEALMPFKCSACPRPVMLKLTVCKVAMDWKEWLCSFQSKYSG